MTHKDTVKKLWKRIVDAESCINDIYCGGADVGERSAKYFNQYPPINDDDDSDVAERLAGCHSCQDRRLNCCEDCPKMCVLFDGDTSHWEIVGIECPE